MRKGLVRKTVGGLAAGGLALALAGCSGRGGADNDFTMTFGNLLAYNRTTVPPAPAMGRELAVECPSVGVDEGQSAYRAMAGGNVRYQFSLGDIARDCSAQDGSIAIRVGISGYLLAGPAGGSGTFSVPVRILVRSQNNGSTVATRVVRVSATIPPGEAQASFAVVADPITVPYLRPEADQDYEIFVGIDPRGGAAEPPARRARRG